MKLHSALFHNGFWHPITLQFQTVPGLSGFSLLGLTCQQQLNLRERLKTVLSILGFKLPNKKVIIDYRNLVDGTPLPTGPLTIGPELATSIGVILLFKKEKSFQHLFPNIEENTLSFLYKSLIIGNLSLDGSVLPIHHTTLFSLQNICKISQKNSVLAPPFINVKTCSLSFSFDYLQLDHLKKLNILTPHKETTHGLITPSIDHDFKKIRPYFFQLLDSYSDTQPELLAALLLSLSCRLPLIIGGEPGSGKTRALEQLSTFAQALVEGGVIQDIRMPHNSLTYAGLVGSAINTQGEAAKAHNGILILDELSCFSLQTLDAFRHILDTGSIFLSRSQLSLRVEASFLLWATTNLCPCGYRLSYQIPCRCKPSHLNGFLRKLNGPLLSRFALQVLLSNYKPVESFQSPLGILIQDACKSKTNRKDLFNNFCRLILKNWFFTKHSPNPQNTPDHPDSPTLCDYEISAPLPSLEGFYPYVYSQRDLRWSKEISWGLSELLPQYTSLTEHEKNCCFNSLRKVSKELYG